MVHVFQVAVQVLIHRVFLHCEEECSSSLPPSISPTHSSRSGSITTGQSSQPLMIIAERALMSPSAPPYPCFAALIVGFFRRAEMTGGMTSGDERRRASSSIGMSGRSSDSDSPPPNTRVKVRYVRHDFHVMACMRVVPKAAVPRSHIY